MTLRHFWNSTQKQCDCGNKTRVWILGHWVCTKKLEENLFKQGFRLEQTDEDQNAEFDQAGELT